MLQPERSPSAVAWVPHGVMPTGRRQCHLAPQDCRDRKLWPAEDRPWPSPPLSARSCRDPVEGLRELWMSPGRRPSLLLRYRLRCCSRRVIRDQLDFARPPGLVEPWVRADCRDGRMASHPLPGTVWTQLFSDPSCGWGPKFRSTEPSALSVRSRFTLFLLGNGCPVCSSDRV